jgi:hypothetical protein
VVYSAEAADRFYLVVDESALNDKLTPGTEYILNSLIGVHEFATAAERTAYVASRGWTSSDS